MRINRFLCTILPFSYRAQLGGNIRTTRRSLTKTSCVLSIPTICLCLAILVSSVISESTYSENIEADYFSNPVSPFPAPIEEYGMSENNSSPLMEARTMGTWNITDTILVTTIDGSLNALDRNSGELRWSIKNNAPLVSIKPFKNLKPESPIYHDDFIWFIEPLGDGTLYTFSEGGLSKIPASIKEIVMGSPFAVPGDDRVYVGSRYTTLYSVDIITGRIRKTYSTFSDLMNYNKCDANLENNEECTDWIEEKDSFTIGKTEYHITVYGRDDLKQKLVYSSWGPNTVDLDLVSRYDKSLNNIYIMTSHDGKLIAFDNTKGTILWVSNLSSIPIVVFDIFSHDHLIMLPQPKYQSHKGNENKIFEEYVLIQQTSDNTWFAMSDRNFPLVRGREVAPWYSNTDKTFNLNNQLHESLKGLHKINLKFTDTYEADFVQLLPNSENYALNELDSERQNFGVVNTIFNDDIFSLGLIELYAREIINLSTRWFQSLFGKAVEAVFSFLIIVIIIIIGGRFWLIRNEVSNRNVFLAKGSHNLSDKPPLAFEQDLNGNSLIDIGKSDNNVKELADNSEETFPLENVNSAFRSDLDSEENISELEKYTGIEEQRDERTDAEVSYYDDSYYDDSEYTEDQISIVIEDSLGKGILDNVNNDTSNLLLDGLSAKTSDRHGYKKESIIYENSLIVSKKILGYGSHGTVVFQGKYYNRDVAVKRLLLDFYDVASHEIALLQESNDHPNIIRYFCKQENKKFLYIALELCSASLYDVIEKPQLYPDLVNQMTPKNTLYQITNGISYLHSLKMVHRDIKPQNILVAPPRKNRITYSSYYHYNEHSSPVRILVTDFGVSKKLDIDQSSFGPTSTLPAGTSGWMAPELLGSSTSNRPRGTRAIDIFSLGCVFYYVLSGGLHPFGLDYDRNSNIIRNKVSLNGLDHLDHDYSECVDLINRMIAHEPKDRPDITDVLLHPYFWTSSQRLEFLVKLSDRMDSEIKEPPSPLIASFESQSQNIVGKDWHTRFEKVFINELERQRKYRGERIIDLLRAMRNKCHHYGDLPENILKMVGSLPDGYLAYFTRKFPFLFMHCYYFVKKYLQEEERFVPFFKLTN